MTSATSPLFIPSNEYEESVDVMLSEEALSETELRSWPREKRRTNVFLEVVESNLGIGLGSFSLRLPSLKKKVFDLDGRRSGILGGDTRSP